MVLLAVIYLSFISLGLPDALLGAAWPAMYEGLGAPVSYAGLIFTIICGGTVVSSLMSGRLTHRFGAGRVTAVSAAMTAAAQLGFASSGAFWQLCLWAIPCGLGAGGVDAALNSYVALHYASRHMSWLHCMWGVGASVGPYIMGHVLSGGQHWSGGYRSIGALQAALTMVLFFSLPLWKGRNHPNKDKAAERADKPLSLPQIIKIPGAREVMATFFCYCALEQTTGLWASSYLVLHKGVDAEAAASFAGMFFIGITAGRALNGFLTMKLNDAQLIRLGLCVAGGGIAAMLLPMGETVSLIALVLIGLGCAPIYPCIIHSTPEHFGADHSQALIGVQMASAYVGNCVMPPLFGLLANHISAALLPVYLLALLVIMVFMHERLILKCEGRVQ